MIEKRVGLGCCRVSVRNEEQVEALVHGFESGIRLVDTAAHFADGESEQAVGEALRRSGVAREAVTILSKAGYIGGRLLARVRAGEERVEGRVPCREGGEYSIDPDFLRRRIDDSLERLGCGWIDTYLIQDPERLLTSEEPSGLQRRLRRAFVALEEEILRGRIRGYGIAAAAFARGEGLGPALPCDRLLDLAREAGAEAGAAAPGLTTIQLPLNRLEPGGLGCAAWAKAHGLRVVTTRPLDAFVPEGPHRLASYDAPADYAKRREAVLAAADRYSLSELRSVVTDLDALQSAFSWPQAAEETLRRRTLPFLKGVLARLPDPALKATILPLLDPFLQSWQASVAHHSAQKARALLARRGIEAATPLQHDALRWLLAQSPVDAVLVGMRRKRYVDDVLAALSSAS